MLIAKIYENDIDKENHLYLNEQGLSGYGIDENGFGEFSMTLLNDIKKLFEKKDYFVFLNNYHGYDIYYDQENQVNHFYKDSKEDFSMFFEFNNIEDIRYMADEQNKISPAKIKSYCVAFKHLMLDCSKEFIHFLEGWIDLGIKNFKVHRKETFPLNMFKLKSYEDFLEVLNLNTHLSDKEKSFLSNKSLFKDIFKYYPTVKKYILLQQLHSLKIKYESLKEYNEEHNCNSAAYYRYSTNEIHGEKKINSKHYLGHEFFHLLQFHRGVKSEDLSYIREALADIVNYEYYDAKFEGYPNHVKNIRMLMDVIGPRIIWEYTLSGNSEELKRILKTYLTKDDYKQMIIILKNHKKSNHEELSQLIEVLYRNIYHEDIKTNRNMFFPNGEYINKRIYINERKMKDNIIWMNEIEAIERDLIKAEKKKAYVTKVDNKTFDTIQRDLKLCGLTEDVDYTYKIAKYNVLDSNINVVQGSIDGSHMCTVIFKDGSKENMPLKTAVDLGYIEITDYSLKLPEELIEKYNLQKSEESEIIKVIPKLLMVAVDNPTNASRRIGYRISSIKEMHPLETIGYHREKELESRETVFSM